MSELVSVHLFDPSGPSIFKGGANDRALCIQYRCTNRENCGLYARKECAQRVIFGDSNCPYGTRSSETGFTKRARKNREWINSRKEKYGDLVYYLKSPTKMLAEVGDYVYLPYPHMNETGGNLFEHEGGLLYAGSAFVKREKFTADNIARLVKCTPSSWGKPIHKYQLEIVPLFLAHLSEQMPDLFKEVCEVAEIDSSQVASNIGRKALISSLLPGVEISRDRSREKWVWDGEYLVSNNPNILIPFVKFEEAVLKLKPKPGETFTVTDESQVSDTTEFVS